MTSEELLRDLEEKIGIHESDSDKFHADVKSYALQIAQEAVEEEKAKYNIGKYTTGSHLDSLAQSAKMALDSLLTRIKKLTEES